MRRRHPLVLPLLLCAIWLAWPIALPPVREATRVTDRAGLLIAERPAPERAPGEALSALSPELESAFLAAEDRRFRYHPGVDPLAIARAAWANLQAGEVVQGGSTLTQQLVRSTWERPPGLPGKVWEAALALRLELHYSKDEILREYLNRLYFGGLSYGVDAAARACFDKPATALSPAEAALLAALPHRPEALDPWRHPDAARAARDRVLDRMEALGSLGAEEASQARAQPLGLRKDAPFGNAPHFVRRLGPHDGELRTTLDLGLQREVERLTAATVESLRARGATQAAVVVVDTRSAEVLAYVGSAGWTTVDGQNDGAMAPRSPGSALKPFTYWLALERGARAGGITLATVLPDLPGSWSTTHGTWSPSNYDERFHGPISARSALAMSLNLPAVRALEGVGVAELVQRLQDLGLSTLTERPDHYGLGLTLGDGEVRLDELVAAYVALANGGVYRPLKMLQDAEQPLRAVGDSRAAWLVLDALDDPDARAPAFGVDSPLEPGFALAAKTGTSVGWRDNWAIGASPEVVVGVWVGNFDGQPMGDVSGITGAGPLLAAVLELAHTGVRNEYSLRKFDPNRQMEARKVCPLSGMLVGEDCPGSRVERFLPGTAPTQRCDWHREIEVDDSGALATGCAHTHRVLSIAWPPAFAAWAAETRQVRWPEVDHSCAPQASPTLPSGIAWPSDGMVFFLDADRPAEHQALSLRAAAPAGAREAVWTVDGAEIARVGAPFSARWVPVVGEHRVGLRVDGVEAGSVRVWVGG